MDMAKAAQNFSNVIPQDRKEAEAVAGHLSVSVP